MVNAQHFTLLSNIYDLIDGYLALSNNIFGEEEP